MWEQFLYERIDVVDKNVSFKRCGMLALIGLKRGVG
jgi:hypothetical protein